MSEYEKFLVMHFGKEKFDKLGERIFSSESLITIYDNFVYCNSNQTNNSIRKRNNLKSYIYYKRNSQSSKILGSKSEPYFPGDFPKENFEYNYNELSMEEKIIFDQLK